MSSLDQRLRKLEAAAAPTIPRLGRHVVVDVVADGRRLPVAERERRIAEAHEQAGPNGMVIVVDCPTCLEDT